jgi:hypothetical protein
MIKMGNSFMDRYSLLHFCVGVVAYFLGIPFVLWVLLHFCFEVLENIPSSVNFIDHYFKMFWPGGKHEPDTILNSMGDNFFAIIGWLVPYSLFGPIKRD